VKEVHAAWAGTPIDFSAVMHCLQSMFYFQIIWFPSLLFGFLSDLLPLYHTIIGTQGNSAETKKNFVGAVWIHKSSYVAQADKGT
jgi:hypothetical protein